MNRYKLIDYDNKENAEYAKIVVYRLSRTIFKGIFPESTFEIEKKSDGTYKLIIQSEDEMLESDLDNIKNNINRETIYPEVIMNEYELINYDAEENANNAATTASMLSITILYGIVPRFNAFSRKKPSGGFVLIIESEDEICESDLDNIRDNIIVETFSRNTFKFGNNTPIDYDR